MFCLRESLVTNAAGECAHQKNRGICDPYEIVEGSRSLRLKEHAQERWGFFELLAEPFVLVTARWIIEARQVVQSTFAIPINRDETHVPIHKAHHVFGIVELFGLPAIVSA